MILLRCYFVWGSMAVIYSADTAVERICIVHHPGLSWNTSNLISKLRIQRTCWLRSYNAIEHGQLTKSISLERSCVISSHRQYENFSNKVVKRVSICGVFAQKGENGHNTASAVRFVVIKSRFAKWCLYL